MRRLSFVVGTLALLAMPLAAQMGHSVEPAPAAGAGEGPFSGTGDLGFFYDKLTDSTLITGAMLMDAHTGSNFLMSVVSGHNFRPTVGLLPSYRVEGKKHQPTSPPDSVEIVVTATLDEADAHTASRMDAKAPESGQLILLIDDSVRTRVPLRLLDTDSYIAFFAGGQAQAKGTVSYLAVVPYAFLVRWTSAQKVEGRMPSGDFNLHGKDAHKWQAFADYLSGKAIAAAP